MIAQRFRPLGWVAGIALAATGLYLVSLQVASARGRLEAIDHKITVTKRDIRQLQTEMGTRASLRQLERWNGEVLSLSAPRAGQYLRNDAALAALDHDDLGRLPATAPPATTIAAVKVDKIVPSKLTSEKLAAVALLDNKLIDRGMLTTFIKSEGQSNKSKNKP